MSMFVLERVGAAPAVVCLHGFCQSSEYWAPTLDRLAAVGVHGVAPDLPGFARSAAERGPYTMMSMADAVVRLLDARRLDRVALVGGSMGGVVAQQLVLRHPDRVERLLLVATGAVMGNPAAGLAKADEIASAPWDEAAVVPVVAGFFHRPPDDDRVQHLRRIARAASKEAAEQAARSNAQSDTREQIGAIRVPTLIIQGKLDRARTPEHGALMRDRIAGSQLALIADAGHTPQLEQAEAFHEIAIPFLLAGTRNAANNATA